MLQYGQIAQSVEQGIENPRVGGSIPSLATFLFLLIAAGGCEPDRCDQLCRLTTNRLESCMDAWSMDWEDFDASSKANFRRQCTARWGEVRSNLESRELEDAQGQCEETSLKIAELQADGDDCDHLRSLYVD